MTVLARHECQHYVGKAVDYVCKLGRVLSDAQTRAFLADAAVREAEAAVDAAALAWDVEQTKAACRSWWEAARQAITTIRQEGETA